MARHNSSLRTIPGPADSIRSICLPGFDFRCGDYNIPHLTRSSSHALRSPRMQHHGWNRLIRFVAVEDGAEHYGQPVDDELDGQSGSPSVSPS